MKNYICNIAAILIFLFANNLNAAETTSKEWGGINENQPISVGELIYEDNFFSSIRADSMASLSFSNSYTYAGIENNSLKVEQREISHISTNKSEEVKTKILNLPINANKQVLLKVNPVSKKKPTQELLITITDEFYRITVKELNK
ncbi:MAG: hypothetical protein L6416_08330 [Candidatus Omnitrophica bacterium]|nr:hypothetical protein [Candidatus Omnitrophota bacterium]